MKQSRGQRLLEKAEAQYLADRIAIAAYYLRLEKGLTEVKIAEAIGLSTSVYREIEYANAGYNNNALKKLLEYHDCQDADTLIQLGEQAKKTLKGSGLFKSALKKYQEEKRYTDEEMAIVLRVGVQQYREMMENPEPLKEKKVADFLFALGVSSMKEFLQDRGMDSAQPTSEPPEPKVRKAIKERLRAAEEAKTGNRYR